MLTTKKATLQQWCPLVAWASVWQFELWQWFVLGSAPWCILVNGKSSRIFHVKMEVVTMDCMNWSKQVGEDFHIKACSAYKFTHLSLSFVFEVETWLTKVVAVEETFFFFVSIPVQVYLRFLRQYHGPSSPTFLSVYWSHSWMSWLVKSIQSTSSFEAGGSQ